VYNLNLNFQLEVEGILIDVIIRSLASKWN